MAVIAQSRVRLTWPQDQAIPLGSTYDVFFDAADGSVDYADGAQLNVEPIDAWPDGEGKRGAGLGAAGYGPAGYGASGVGAGYGGAGFGPAGFGVGTQQFVSGYLDDATYKFAVLPRDPAGNALTPATDIETIALAGIPQPPGVPAATAYAGGMLTLTWALSPDDAG